MATFQEAKAFIDTHIKDNENGEITGNLLNEALTLLLGTSKVYIGEEAPTDDGAKLWIDPTGTPSGGNGGETSGGGHILVYWYKLTDEQKAHNATAYQQILNEFKVGRFPRVIVANSEIAGANSMGTVGLYGGHPATEISIIDPDSQAAEMLGEISMGIRFSDIMGEKYLYITPDGVEHNYND